MQLGRPRCTFLADSPSAGSLTRAFAFFNGAKAAVEAQMVQRGFCAMLKGHGILHGDVNTTLSSHMFNLEKDGNGFSFRLSSG